MVCSTRGEEYLIEEIMEAVAQINFGDTIREINTVNVKVHMLN